MVRTQRGPTYAVGSRPTYGVVEDQDTGFDFSADNTIDEILGGTTVRTSTATGHQFDDSIKLNLGTGSDLVIYHDGTNSYIDNGTGKLILDNAGALEFQWGAVGGLKWDDAALTGFAGATSTAGKDIFVQTQDAGTAAADEDGTDGGDLEIRSGDGAAGGAHTANDPDGGNGGDITISAGTGGAAGAGGSGVAGRRGFVKTNTVFFPSSAAQTIDMNDATVSLTMDVSTGAGTAVTSNVLMVDPNSMGASETLELPYEADCAGLVLYIMNTGGEGIDVTNDAGSNIGSGAVNIATAECGLFACDGTTWYGGVMKGT